LAVALTLSGTVEANAQADTTRRATSEQRIPIRKEVGVTEDVTRRTSTGEVGLAPRTRIDSLEALANSYSSRIDSLERANASLVTRLDETDRLIASLRDSLNTVRSELATAKSEIATVRTELSETTARTARLADSLQGLNRRFVLFRNRSMFGNSGFYVGLGTGPAYTRGTLSDIGYIEGMQVTVPIGWHKTGSMFGVRTEWAWQNYDGRVVPGAFSNVDPNVYSGTAMASLHVPFNEAKTHTVYVMGGAGVYHFRDFQPSSALGSAFGDGTESADSETKWGLVGGLGLQFHILGATYLFAQSTFNNVSADRAVSPGTSKNLQWVPLVLGVTVR
jgi:opacity protein-like surface antigen